MGKRLAKPELLKEISFEKERLDSLIDKLPSDRMMEPGVTPGGWSIKDILAHLVGWQRMILSFHAAELRGEIAEIPGYGLTWRETPKLNSIIFEKHKDLSLDEVLSEYRSSHNEMLRLLDEVSDEDLVSVRRFRWLGPSWTVSDYIRAETASHYRWASNHIKRWMRAKA